MFRIPGDEGKPKYILLATDNCIVFGLITQEDVIIQVTPIRITSEKEGLQ